MNLLCVDPALTEHRALHQDSQGRSNRSGENVFIYARPRGGNIEMMVLVHEKDETVLVRIVADGEMVAREFGEPRRVVKLAER